MSWLAVLWMGPIINTSIISYSSLTHTFTCLNLNPVFHRRKSVSAPNVVQIS